MRKSLFVLALPVLIVALSTTSSSDSSAADPPVVNPGAPSVVRAPSRDDDDDGTTARARSARASLADANKKIAPILKADARTAPLVKDPGQVALPADGTEQRAITERDFTWEDGLVRGRRQQSTSSLALIGVLAIAGVGIMVASAYKGRIA